MFPQGQGHKDTVTFKGPVKGVFRLHSDIDQIYLTVLALKLSVTTTTNQFTAISKFWQKWLHISVISLFLKRTTVHEQMYILF